MAESSDGSMETLDVVSHYDAQRVLVLWPLIVFLLKICPQAQCNACQLIAWRVWKAAGARVVAYSEISRGRVLSEGSAQALSK